MSAEDSLNVGKSDVVIADHAWRKFLRGDFPMYQAILRSTSNAKLESWLTAGVSVT
jgi:hypothetical protein